MKRPRLFAFGLICLLAGLPAASENAQTPQTSSTGGNLQSRMQRAAGLLQKGEIEAAEVELKAILSVAPRHGPANLLLGQIRLERGELEAARENLEIAASSNLRRPYLGWYLLGRTLLAQGEPELARESFDRALVAAPEFAPARLGRARAAIRLGDLDQVGSLEGLGPDGIFLRAEVSLAQEQEDKATALLEPLATRASASAESLTAQMLLLSLGGAEEMQLLRRLVGENLQLARSYLALGLAEMRVGETERAANALRIALEIDDQDPVPWLLLQEVSDDENLTSYPDPLVGLATKIERAHELQAEGKSVEAEAVVEPILAQRPFHVPARLIVVLGAEQQEEPWKALVGYRQLFEWMPQIPTLQASAARVAHSMKAEELAECLARRALQSMPDEASLYYLLAVIQSEVGDWEASAASCRKAIELGMEVAPLYLTLGRVEYERMHIGASIAAFAKAVELDPDADRAVPRFALATLSTEEFDALRDLMQVEIARDPNGESTLYTLGLMSLRKKDFAAARSYFEKLSALLPEDTQVQHHLGTAYMREGDREKGKAALERFRMLKAAEEEAWVEHNQAYRTKLEAQDAAAAGDAEGALRMYNDLASAGLAEEEDFLAAGSLYLGVGDFERAYRWYEQILESNPYQREALDGLAEAAGDLGRTEVAAQARARADLLAWPCSLEP